MSANRTIQTVDTTPAYPSSSLAAYRVGARFALSLDGAIAAWLHEKLTASGSQRTRDAYADLLADYRAELRRAGFDLDSADERALALLAQAWAARPRAGMDSRGRPLRHAGQPVSASTHNLRLAEIGRAHV